MDEFHKGDLIWFDPGFGYSVPGEVIEFHRAGQVITIQSFIDGKAQVFTMNTITNVRRRHDLGPYGIEDMIQLGDLNEASLLWNLRTRYDKQLIYTYIGSILIAVNPYKMFDIYGLNIVKKYEEHLFGTLPPHLFSIGSAAYFRMSKDKENQVVVISGESGAGKTESTKLIMQYLAAVNKSSSNLITEQILEASPLLESFGNAKTGRNDNSSRFGKYLEVHFKSGVIIGAKTTEYLLEKSRIVTQAPEERNYHVFYEMLAGLDKERRDEYGLMSPDKYFYLNQGGNCEIPCKDDAEDFLALLSAMQVLGFTSEEQEVIFKILAAVLHLGNIYFNKKQLKHGQEGVGIGKDVEVKWAAHLLQLSVDGIVAALTTKTTEARNEKLLTPLNFDQALDARDAIAKALYSSLFSWLVQRINNIICKGQKNTSIAILDIFGFEDFKENSFEQLCINYANETLQYYFNKHIFKLEQQEYAKEKIDWQVITFQDNQPVINLISKKPVGIFHLLDDESNFPKATDLSFLEKCHYNHALNELYSRPRMSSMEFGIKHYAGQVWYSVEGFLDKNRDTLRSDVVELLISSRVSMISKMFSDLKSNAEVNKTMNRSNGRFVTMKPRTPTVAARFHDSLLALVENMTRCNPWFVRCIKPNNEKAPMNFDMCVVLEQLQYTGMLETIKIRKMGYPIRLRFSAFADRYKCLLQERVPKGVPSREVCRVIIDRFARKRDEYQLGTSKLFLRENVEHLLEQERNQILNSAAVVIQKHLRARFARKRYLTLRRNAVRFQSRIRGFLVRQEFKRKREAAIKIQAYMRMMKQKHQYQKLKEEEKLKQLADKEAKERAKIKAHKMELERAAQATAAGINHLEIPAELAFIFSKLDDWKPPYTDRNITKVVGQILPLEESYQLPLDLDYHPFSKFVNVYFKSQVWGAKQQPLKAPLLSKLKENDYHESLAVFKLILRFMKDSNLVGRREILLGDYIVQKGLRNESLRDEILCQLCNQTWKNEKESCCERGWLLIANCLSCFPPSKTLYKYLLKYVSDHGYGDFATIGQKKLLQSEKVDFYSIRNYPPCMLEWRANRKHFGMALPVNFYDDETVYGPLESWTTGEEFAANIVKSRGIRDNWGWSLNMVNFNIKKELNGYDYVFDLITEEELPPAFPVCKSPFLFSGDPMHAKKSNALPTRSEFESVEKYSVESMPHSKNKRSMMRSRSQEILQEDNHNELLRSKVKSQSHEWLIQDDAETGLSRYSALNERYFEKNSEDAYPSSSANHFGLSHSKLNERYRSVDNLPESSKTSKQNYFADSDFNRVEKKQQKLEVQIPDINDAKEENDLKWGLSSSALNDRYFHHSDKESKYEMDRGGTTLSQDDFSEANINMNGHSDIEAAMSEDAIHSNGLLDFPEFDFQDVNNGDFDLTKNNQSGSRFVKQTKKSQSSTYSHSTKGYLETKDFAPRSSALSDTSEAPSLASHVKQVRVPSHTSDLDQYLDDLFNPVLDGNLDELSDARSLAASIKGGQNDECSQNESSSASNPSHSSCSKHIDEFISKIFDSVAVNGNVNSMRDSHVLSQSLKGSGKGFGQMDNQGPSTSSVPMMNMMLGGIQSPLPGMMSPPPMLGTNNLMNSFPMMPAINPTVPMYSIGGLNLPMWNGAAGVMDPSQLALQQQLLQQQQQQAMQVNASQMQQMQQRAFVASAFQQNLQIQQQLIQQNRALQQLLQQAESPTDSPKTASVSPRHASNSKDITTPMQEKTIKKTRGVEFSDSDQIMWNDERSPWGASPASPASPPPLPPKSNSAPNYSPTKLSEKSPPLKFSPNRHIEDDSIISNGYRHQNDFTLEKPSPGKSKFIPTGNIPPPPPLPPEPPDGDRPFTNVYGRAKTVRIGKWRWPPPRTEENEEDTFFEFKMRSNVVRRPEDERQFSSSSEELDHSPESKEWRSYSQNQEPSKQSFMLHGRNQAMEMDSPDNRPAGSIGKLKISSEMKAKLEALTLNHSVRSTSNKNDARRVYAAVNKLKAQAKDGNSHVVQKLEEDRKLALQRKLGGYDVSDYRNQSESMHTKNDTLEKESRSHAPPPPVAPPSFNIPPPPPSSNSFYDHSEITMMKTKSPPPPVSPSGGMYQHHHQQSHVEEKIEHVSEMEKYSSSYVSKQKEMDNYERKKLKFYGTNKLLYITYTRTPWKLYVRKEIFYPGEQFSNPLVLHLLFCQIVLDVFLLSTVRLTPEEVKKLKQLLDGYGITPNNLHSTHHKSTIKKNVIDIVREFPVYFSRLFSVSGGRHDSDVEMVGISHSGLKLIKRQRQMPNDWLRVLQEYSFDDMVSLNVPRSSTLQIMLRNGRQLIFYTHRAGHMKKLVDKFLFESEAGAISYVRAIADYVTRESTLLSFQEGDVIRVVNRNAYDDKGWLNGSIHGRTGIFPSEYVVPLGRHDVQHGFGKRIVLAQETNANHSSRIPAGENRPKPYPDYPVHTERPVEPMWLENERPIQFAPADKTGENIFTSSGTQANDGKHSLLQFALLNFRESLNKYEMLRKSDGSIRGSLKMIESLKSKKKSKKGKESDWTWKEQVELVKYTKSPIQASLLKLETSELNKLALECFLAIMKYMGDYPLNKNQTDVDCVYSLLMSCHHNHNLRDEVYCQIMKQTTNNKSPKPDSCQKGWRLFSILAAYFDCSDVLKPYLYKYLETAAYDKRRAYHGTAMVCLQNLRKTFKFGGRKNVPSIEEITAITAGRNSKRQIYRLPGGTERIINTKSTSVVADIIEEICGQLNIRVSQEMEEFSLYCIVEGDSFTMPLAREEYILDVTTELHKNHQVFYLIFCRSVWYYPLRLDSQLYIEVVFNQTAPDYLEGLLIISHEDRISTDLAPEIAKIAALLHRAQQMDTPPNINKTKYLLPKPALAIRDIKPPEWVNMVQSFWVDIELMSPMEAKAQFLELLQKWPLFGSSFFAVKRHGDGGDLILAVNSHGVHFFDGVNHENISQYPFSEIISTRKVKTEDGALLLDMKIGNLMVQKINRIQTEQAHEISQLIKRYIMTEQRNKGMHGNQAEASRDILHHT